MGINLASARAMPPESIGTPLLWAGFTIFVLAMLALDLGVFHRKAHQVGVREALVWTGVWIAIALLFNVGVYVFFGTDRALEFLTGYLIEKALSVDNIFVFLVIFSTFGVPGRLQHRVLFWGVLGALVTRVVFIVLGAAAIHRFEWLHYVLGAFLVVVGVRLFFQRAEAVHPEKNPVLNWFRKRVSLVNDYESDRFFVRVNGKLFATPLLLVLVAIESTDVVFAVDSIPAIFGVTTDPFIVYTSNVFAILGLRALYFALAGALGRFRHLKYGLALILVFVGAKMLLAIVYDIPTAVSLAVIASILAVTLLVSSIWSGSAPDERGSSKPPGRDRSRNT